jgi:RNA polymerase sigma-70 factor (ECF subfamily)
VNGFDVDAEELDDNNLLERIAVGDRRAFRCLMVRHGKSMLALAQRITGNPDDADEIVQEAFLKVWLGASRWRSDGGAKFSSWFYRVVMNASLDRCRRKPMASLDDVDDPCDNSPGGFDNVSSNQRHTVLVDALGTMPVRQKEAMSLFYFAEMSAPTAAKMLNVSVSAFEALLIRGKQSLRTALLRRGIRSLGDLI